MIAKVLPGQTKSSTTVPSGLPSKKKNISRLLKGTNVPNRLTMTFNPQGGSEHEIIG